MFFPSNFNKISSFWWFVFTKTLLVSLSKQFSVKKLTLNTVFGLLKFKYSAQTPFRLRIVNIYQIGVLALFCRCWGRFSREKVRETLQHFSETVRKRFSTVSEQVFCKGPTESTFEQSKKCIFLICIFHWFCSLILQISNILG